MRGGRFTSRAAEERGAAMIMVAGSLPLLILFVSFVIDIGNWFEHRRHLQMQADAAVLAAAGEFGTPCSEAPMDDMARTYGGLKPPAPDTYNQQVGGTPLENVLFEGLNQDTWPNQPDRVDPDPPGGPPCQTGVLDVKLAEADLPWFFRAAQVPFINAHARVEIQKIDRMRGVLPIGVPDINPKKAKAFFVDESKAPGEAGYIIKETMLCRTGAQNGLAVWSSAGGCIPDNPDIKPVPVRVDAKDIGVRIALSGSDSIECGQPLVACYDTQTTGGLSHIRGWSPETATAQSPKARDVWLRSPVGVTANKCPDGYFVAAIATCSVEVVADVNFGPTSLSDPTPIDPVKLGAEVTATVGNRTYPLAYDATQKLWKWGGTDAAQLVPVPAGGSRVSVGLNWKIKTKADGTTCGGTCSGTIEGAAQRAFSASDSRSGPIKQVKVARHPLAGTLNDLGANSFKRCTSAEDTTCVHDLSVTIAIQGSLLDLHGKDSPPVDMRVVSSGSQTQALDCDPDIQKLEDELAQGCAPAYTENDGAGCPVNKAALYASPQPWSCSAIKTGEVTQAISRGINTRVNGGPKATCNNPSHWDKYWADGELEPHEYANDPRVVFVFLTPFGSFDGSGQTLVPIVQFATFYVTGWTGQGGDKNPCPVKAEGGTDDQPADDKGGYLIGHFINYRQRINNGEGSGEACDFDAVQICVPVMTK